jgi:hydroxymethylpyrimidine/phosphomethylpyrimidine kinase
MIIAGSDCSAGAGIQADLKTIIDHGVYATTVITAVTAQNTRTVKQILPMPSHLIDSQIESIYDEFDILAVKIGMLHNQEIIESVSEQLARRKQKNVVLDPVMIASSGASLLANSALSILKEKLSKTSFLITPNRSEAERLVGWEIQSLKEKEEATFNLSHQLKTNVLLKGGHFHEQSTCQDLLYLYESKTYHRFTAKRVNSNNSHGTGCVLSSAIATQLALGNDLISSIHSAKKYVCTMLKKRSITSSLCPEGT